jgi:hypothetical protein
VLKEFCRSGIDTWQGVTDDHKIAGFVKSLGESVPGLPHRSEMATLHEIITRGSTH